MFCAIILFGVMILLHELGHVGAALALGVEIDIFSLGFGPRLFGIRLGGTDFRLSALPFGGYVRTIGDRSGTEKNHASAFSATRASWQRAVIIIAGPLMNIVLAIGIVAGIYMYAYPKQMDTTDPVIASIKAGSPAAQAGLQTGDRIVEFDGRRGPDWDFISMQEALNANHPIKGIIERHGRPARFTITPRMDPKQGTGVAGWTREQNIRVGQLEQGSPAARAGLRPGDLFVAANGQRVASPGMIQRAVSDSGGNTVDFQVMRNGRLKSLTVTPPPTNKPKAPWRIGIRCSVPVQVTKLGLGPALKESVQLNGQNALMVFQVWGGIIEGRVSPKLISGPIGMVQMSREAAQEGVRSYLFLMAFVSLQLAIFNLLPIPILDGGGLLMLIVEMLAQHHVSLQMKEMIFKLGFVFVMLIMLFFIYNDVSKLLT